MAERKNIVKGQIGNAIESVAPDHIATVANQIFDESRQEYQDDINENVGYIIDNPEFVKAYVIRETNQLLWGIQKDGNIYYGAGIPRQIKSYVDFIVSRILNGDDEAPEIDSLNKIIAFLDGFTTSETLFEILLELDDKKVDKVEGKSLIDEEYADGVSYVESPEFKYVRLDGDGKIIEAILNDGSKLFGVGIKVNGNIYANGELELNSLATTTIDNPEFTAIWTVENKIVFGIQRDGNFLFGCGVPRQIEQYIVKYISDVVFGGKDVTEIIDTLNEITIFLDGFISGSNLLEYLNDNYGYYEESPEFIRLILDKDKRIIEATKEDGTKLLPVGLETIKENIDGIIVKTVDSPEYSEARVDSDGRIYFGVRRDGDVIVGGVNVNEMKRSLDVDALEVEYDSNDHSIYVTENDDSTIGLEYDSKTGDIYQVKDSRIDANMTMDESGNVYIEQ